MNHLTILAASYNCTDASSSAYGAGNYSTCETTETTSVGAPSTGDFLAQMTTGQFSVVLPTILAVAIALTSAIALVRKKKKADKSA